jgi:type II secretion system protein H
MLSRQKNVRRASRAAGGFTLVELILVLAVLTMIVALVLPSLKQFFGARTLDSEVLRFVALTRYAQSRAVSEGIPMMLWIDPRNGAYGLQQEPGYTDNDPKAVDYMVGKDVKIDVPAGSQPSRAGSKQYAIYFSPDGAAVAAKSVSGVSLRLANGPTVRIVPSANQLTYEARY